MPMMEMFDRGIQLRMGQAHVKRWIDDLMPLVRTTATRSACTSFATHHLPLNRPRTPTTCSATRRRLHQGRPPAVTAATGETPSVVVVGASSGIGRAVARRFAAAARGW